jgi:RNA polymerase sigma-70 factor (sigma-E family)
MSFRGTATSQPGTTGRRDEADIVTQFRARHLELVRLAALLLGDRAAAEDVVQDVFARVWEGRDRLATAGFTAAYLYRSVVNGCRSVHRRRGAFPPGGAAEAALRSESGASAEDIVLRADEDQRVLRALAALPRRQREALILRYYQRLSEAEIAAAMAISPGTVKSTAARGLAALGRRLRQEEGL